MDVHLHTFLTSALDGIERSASHPGGFTSWVKATSTHCEEERSGLDTVANVRNTVIVPSRK